jgi:hypothetical protein
VGCEDATGVGQFIVKDHPELTFQLARAVPSTQQPSLYLVAIQFTATGQDRQVGVWAAPALGHDVDYNQIAAVDLTALKSVGYPGTIGTDHEINENEPAIAIVQQCIIDSGGNNAPAEAAAPGLTGKPLPDGWPSELPVPNGEVVDPLTTSGGWSATFQVTDISEVERVFTALQNTMTLDFRNPMGSGFSSRFVGSSYYVAYMVTPKSDGAYYEVVYAVVKN